MDQDKADRIKENLAEEMFRELRHLNYDRPIPEKKTCFKCNEKIKKHPVEVDTDIYLCKNCLFDFCYGEH